MKKFGEDKKGQVTIFIIVGILIVVGVALFFVIRTGIIPTSSGGVAETNPNSYLEGCLEEKVHDAVNLISHQGGYAEPNLKLNFWFKETSPLEEYDKGEPAPIDLAYLCYNQNNYYPCVNQWEMPFEISKNELSDQISEEVRNCFYEMTESLETRGYTVVGTYRDFDLDMTTNKIIINVDGEVILTKADEQTKQEDFKVIIPSRFYDLINMARIILNQEANYCSAQTLGLMLLHPQFDIDVFKTGDSDTIFTIQHKDSKEWFRFAIRGCVIPPAF